MTESVIVTNKNFKEINPVAFGTQKCDKSYACGPALRRHWIIHFVVSGCGFYRIEDRKYNIGAGEMFVIPPFVETYYKADDVNPWNYTWIEFEAGNPLPVELEDTIFCPEAQSIFLAMKKCSDYENGASAFLCSKIWELFTLLSKNEKQNNDYVQKALECIHSEYMKDITIEDIAKRLNLARSYFSTMFRKKVGVSPKQYLLNYRMNMATALMIENGASVSVAAYSVGYTDIFTFSKMFKRHYGVSPNEYIKGKQKEV